MEDKSSGPISNSFIVLVIHEIAIWRIRGLDIETGRVVEFFGESLFGAYKGFFQLKQIYSFSGKPLTAMFESNIYQYRIDLYLGLRASSKV